MADEDAKAKRRTGLTKLFNAVLHGRQQLKSLHDANRFLEALCVQQDASACVESIIAAPAGLNAIAKAFRFSGDSAFLNGSGTRTLHYLSNVSIKQLYGGQFLHQILERVVQPPTYWNSLIEGHRNGILKAEGTQAFAWLLLELLACRFEGVPGVREVATQITADGSLINASSIEIKNLGNKIKHFLDSTSPEGTEDRAGGRHDNDFADYRKIKILPTCEEFESTKRPFYRTADAYKSVELERKGHIHLDNQFRLLREDLLGELRNDFQIAIGAKRGPSKTVLTGLEFIGIDCGIISRRKRCSVQLRCRHGIPQLRNISDAKARKKYVIDNKILLKHQSLGCLVLEDSLVAFASVDRDEEKLAEDPAVIVLHIADENSLFNVLLSSKTSKELQFIQVDTAFFAYEPILRCLQNMTEVPLQEQLLNVTPESAEALSSVRPRSIIDTISENRGQDLQDIVGTTQSVKLDSAQADSLLMGLSRKISIIQGPPGTGKSYIGALIARILHDHTTETILVLTYTHHALDQFLTILQRNGIPSGSMVRLGQKSNSNTNPLSISEQPSAYKMRRSTYTMIENERLLYQGYYETLLKKVSEFNATNITPSVLLEYLEFSEYSEYFDAFQIPASGEGMSVIGRGGRPVHSHYLFNRWADGKHAGIFQETVEVGEYCHIWEMDQTARAEIKARWTWEVMTERVNAIGNLVQKYNISYDTVQELFHEKQAFILGEKRIIGCTTTAAAKYAKDIRKASPGIIIVEEAAEILESHILTAMTPNTKQLVLIGDHKQLRPKVNNYVLTVENGDGYDLNRSLFERLVLEKFPHTKLNLQHRMRPEISCLVKFFTYPELENAPDTEDRPVLRGFQDSVIFVRHKESELNTNSITDRRDEGAKSSKKNRYEVDMVLKCVRYLGQQGYNTENVVILTPYLGQLYLLLKTLSRENDPILNDMDSYELIRAGLRPPALANKRKIKISTIDNYQGEESDIVIATLTRSNTFGDIGFMAAPQRVNVLLSRARNALIMIGNADTFVNSRKGKEVWVPLMDQLKRQGRVFNGFPVQCRQHPDTKALITTKEDFDTLCPDGGCNKPCDTVLNCGTHACASHCHQLLDHSKMKCEAEEIFTCPQNHSVLKKCYDQDMPCIQCVKEARAKEKRRKREHKLDQERQSKQRAYAVQLAKVNDQIEHQRRLLRDQADETIHRNTLAQKRQDLANLKQKMQAPLTNLAQATNSPSYQVAQTNQSQANTSSQFQASWSTSETHSSEKAPFATASSQLNDGNPGWNEGESKDDWEWQKRNEGAANEALDSLINMIGLETVKQKFLAMKVKIDTFVRQNVSLEDERFGAALLGNPGTGKTTVARLYGKFLVTVGALPGDYFFECSGSSLADDGVSSCKRHIDKILKAGGGVFFIDEAYQMVSESSYGGKAVLDYLLTETENLIGKVVFVLAGYSKQMEALFEYNPGIQSRIPIHLEFQDYKDQELLQILTHNINSKYKSGMKIEDGMGGLYARIFARRIGRGRGRDGFGNAREVQNGILQITERQAKRLQKERKAGLLPNDMYLTKEDIIGPDPSSILKDNAAWTKLQRLIGLQSVKDNVRVLLDGIKVNYQRELEEVQPVQYSLNKCLIGSPGTGKTTVAKLYGRILTDIGLLSNGEVIVKNPGDFIGDVLGASERKTKAILASTMGKVLIIDEAYMLATASGSASGRGSTHMFMTAVVDTIVAEVQSTPGEDRCVLLLGYKDQMEEMMQNVNPGLARRFPIDSSFVFEDFTDLELTQILELKLKDTGFKATTQAKKVAIELLQKARNKPNFGNAGEIDIILDRAKALHQQHLSAGKIKAQDTFEAIDFDPEFDRGERAATNLPQLFKGMVGCDKLIEKFQGYQTLAASLQALGIDPREEIPFNFLFKGPAGTGKTTTAQKMGKMFYDMGFITQAKMIECSATDLIGEYKGHTGPRVRKQLKKALGKVLLIDEAYQLAEDGFASEAIAELVACLTKPAFAQKLIIILAGYEKGIDHLMSRNPGLHSRFPESVVFPQLSPEESYQLLTKALEAKAKSVPLDINILLNPNPSLKQKLLKLISTLSSVESWGNAREVKKLADRMFAAVMAKATQPITRLMLTEEIVMGIIEPFLEERLPGNGYPYCSKEVGTSPFKDLLPAPPPLR